MKKGKITQKKAQVHIRLVNPNAARRIILSSALDAGRLLAESSDINKIREKKQKTVRMLSRVLREIKILERQLSVAHMPEFTDSEMAHLMPHHPKSKNEVKVEEKAEVKKTLTKTPAKSESERLKDELNQIEEKLKSLQ